MKYYTITENINRGIRIEPVEPQEFDACENPYFFKGKKFKIYTRKWVPDVIGMDCIGYFVVSEKFKKVLEENGFTGYELIPIEIEGLEGKYYILVETNKAKNLSPVDEDMDVFIDLNDLKKADISTVENTKITIVNEKVLNALKKAKLKNLQFKELDELSNDKVMKKFYKEWEKL